MENEMEKTMKHYAVLCGDVFRCLRHQSAESAAQLCLLDALIGGDSVALAEVVEVVSDDGKKFEFDPEQLMAEAGGIAPAKLKFDERTKEQWALPEEVNQLYITAVEREIAHHVRDVFGYVVESDDERVLAARTFHEQAHSSEETLRGSACRAFVWFVRQMSDEQLEESKLTRVGIGEWEPTDEPFNYLEIGEPE